MPGAPALSPITISPLESGSASTRGLLANQINLPALSLAVSQSPSSAYDKKASDLAYLPKWGTQIKNLLGWLKFNLNFWEIELIDSVPVNWTCSIRYSCCACAKRLRSSVSRYT